MERIIYSGVKDSQIMPAVTIKVPMPPGAAAPAKPAPQPPAQSTR